MPQLLQTARWELIVLVVSYSAVILWKLFSSASFAGMLRSRDGTLSPGRVQLLVLTVFTSLQYLLATLHDPSHLHSIPPNLVAALAGSQFLYLGAKAWTQFAEGRGY